ncbi:MAG TPA: ABC transporter ATP-binding protein [Solirubrobacterales bacterium]|nr:ABC transporter ATP-binding protein [Solirubrobacterales bacterium]
MSIEKTITSPAAGRAAIAEAQPAIQVENLHKSFRIPTQRVDSLKERAVHPFSQREYRELHALDGISFEIHQGEFFGIVGRNGSGKSTLLKLLASIYRADAGTIRMAGRLAPFIELGVGFNLDLTARDNVVLNGVMMGLTPQETRNRLDAVIDFAELGDFVDLKLKNYSSGMLVRLAFSLMLEVDADILLIDEVLAVGDASFQQKCADAFHNMKSAGKTIILVTHEMGTVEEYCHRAMLISGGKIELIGDPGAVGRKYLQLNFEEERSSLAEDAPSEPLPESDSVRLLEAHLVDEKGAPITALPDDQPIRVRATLEALRDSTGLHAGLILTNSDAVGVYEYAVNIGSVKEPLPVRAGQRLGIVTEIQNRLVPDHYFLSMGINRTYEGGLALYIPNMVDFVVFGGSRSRGVVRLDQRTEAKIEDGPSA